MSVTVQEPRTRVRRGHQGTTAFTAALILLGVVELVVRTISPADMIPNERGLSNYRAMRLAMQANLTPEIMFVGSSRMQIGILPEEFRQRLEARLGHEVTVGNFAVGGANASENVPLLEYMLRQDKKPQLVVYGISVDQVRGADVFTDRSPYFWDFSDWLRYRREVGAAVDPYLPEVIRNEISNHYHTFRYRGLPLVLLKDLRRQKAPRSFLGESVIEHRVPSTKRLVEDDRLRETVKKHIREVHVVDGKYNFNHELIRRVDQIIGRLLDANVNVLLVEAPNAPIFNEEIPPGTLEYFYKTFEAISARHGITFLKLQDMGLEFPADSFQDPVHLSTEGARIFTKGIASHLPTSDMDRLRRPTKHATTL